MENRAELATPMMQQYLDLKRRYQEEVLFFRLGDFYEMFLDDAVEVSQILHITLTSRNGIPMCGIPYHAAKNYIRRLLDAGKKVAICEQIDLPEAGKGIARREVVQVVTPGTVIDEDFLDSRESSYVAAVIRTGEQLSCAWSSLTDGLFYMTVMPVDTEWEHLRSFLGQVKPREIVVNEEDHITNASFREIIDGSGALITRLPPWHSTIQWGYNQLTEHLATLSLKALGLDETSPQLAATGALLHYLKSHVMSSLEHLQNFTVLSGDEGMQIDEATFRNLELVANLEDGKRERSLLWAIDQTITAGGGRLLRHNLSFPLAQLEAIWERQRHVTWFFDNSAENRRLQDLLREVPDVVRLITRISMRRQNVQDINALKRAVETFFKIISQHQDYYQEFFDQQLLPHDLTKLQEASQAIQAALNEGIQGPFNAGETIRDGYHQELDYLRSLCANGSKRLKEYLNQVKEESGIPTIKLAYNRVIGRYIEVPKTHSDKIPASFLRKQTLVNAERYTTEALQQLESEIASSEENAAELERNLYEQLVGELAEINQLFNAVSHFLSTIDYYQSLASLARTRSFVKPTVRANGPLLIEEGRHPVVERFLPLGSFVPNPLKMEQKEERFCLITGPNMAGKSTYLRQNALIVLLAHIGSFVPASSATIPLVDKLYCRIGSSDNIARGESTFLVEMQESAFILRTATEKSFVIMDEVGRGTSTQDGMSIAYAIMQDLIERNIKTLFATHYHELTMLDTSAMQLATLEVVEKGKKIHFLRRLKEGVADSSYGLHVAAMAGMPAHVVRLAAAFQKRHFADYSVKALSDQLDLFVENSPEGSDSKQLEVLQRLQDFEIDRATPLEALAFIENLQHQLEE